MSAAPINAQEAASALLNASQSDLDSLLDQLEIGQEAVKLKAREVAEMAVAVTVAKLAGQNTKVAEAALVASTKNLVSMASISVAQAVLGFAQDTLLKVGSTVIQLVIAAI